MLLRTAIEILAAAAVSPGAPLQDCRAIADPRDRLACYDARDGTAVPSSPPSPPASAPTVPVPPVAIGTAPAAQRAPAPAPTRPATDAEIVRATPTGQVASITPLSHGLYRIQLDDGRQFDTTSNVSAPPQVGEAVSLRRTAIGTTFMNVRGRSPITVRLLRQYR
ncbi:MAG: hypothetical protein J7485_07935 [Sphingobium sp.]|nr:hypothetical protein [Sphingobium sp.]